MLPEDFLNISIIFGQARRACQRQRSILLEFDTRGEVEDFQRLVRIVLSEIYTFFRNCHILSHVVTFCQMWFSLCPQVRDEHLGLKPDRLVWLGVSYQQVSFSVTLFLEALSYYHQQLGFRYQYNLMDAGLMLNLSPNVTHQEGVDCANLE